MAAQSQEKTIGGLDYECSIMLWGHANQLWGKLVNSLGPALGAMANGLSMAELLNADVGAGITEISKLKATDVEYVVGKLIETGVVRVRGAGGEYVPIKKREQWDNHFAGRYMDAFKVIGLALEVNFGDFLSGVRDAVKNKAFPQTMTPSSSMSPTPSTGESGES